MESLNKDVLFNIATMLDLDDLLSFCSSSDRIDRLVCQDENIWNFKLVKEFSDYKSHINKRGREAYELLVGLTKLNKEFKYKGSIYELYSTNILSLDNNQITKLPPEIDNLNNLRELRLNNNQIKTLPPEIGKLINLQSLCLFDNQIKILPPEIGKLSNLRGLYLSNNQIKILPPEIGNLSNLQELVLHKNQIKILPPEIGNLNNLRGIWLVCNEIEYLPFEMSKLTNLQELYLDEDVLISSDDFYRVTNKPSYKIDKKVYDLNFYYLVIIKITKKLQYKKHYL
jgi:hypothetical protein